MSFPFAFQNPQASLITNANILLLMQAAEELGVHWEILNPEDCKQDFRFVLKKGLKEHAFRVMNFGINKWKYKKIAIDKQQTTELLQRHHIPTLPSEVITSIDQYLQIATKIGFPQVIKPLDGTKGRHVYVNIPDQKAGLEALMQGMQKYQQWIIQPFFQGQDYRFLLLGGVLIGIAKRTPPTITGNGHDTIYQLVLKENDRRFQLNEQAGYGVLNPIPSFHKTQWYLERRGYHWQTILPANETILVYEIANFQTGSSVTTLLPNQFHPSILELTHAIQSVMSLNFIGIDMLIKDPKQPASPENVTIIEVNSEPANRLHDLPNQGDNQGVSEKIIRYFFGETPKQLL